jgi:hypothetical protein
MSERWKKTLFASACVLLVLLLVQFGFFGRSNQIQLPPPGGDTSLLPNSVLVSLKPATRTHHAPAANDKAAEKNSNGDDWNDFSILQDPRHVHGRATAPWNSRESPSAPSCQRILLYASSQLDPNGIGAQLNTYLQAVLTALATNRRLVLLHKLRKSYFGCVPDDDKDRHGNGRNTTETTGTTPYPGGLSRLVNTPEWLTGKCALPCHKGTLEWLQVARDLRQQVGTSGDQEQNFNKHLISCPSSDHTNSNVSVLVLGGYSLRRYFAQRVVPVLSRPDAIAVWGPRLGMTPSAMKELRALHSIVGHNTSKELNIHLQLHRQQDQQWAHEILGRLTGSVGGLIRFQPWIARDVQARLQAWENEASGLFLSSSSSPPQHFYIGVHVRRGDKLLVESKYWVDEYWKRQERQHGNRTATTTPNFIPFSAYVDHIKAIRGQEEKTQPIHVYVATDDPVTVREEIATLPVDVVKRFWFWFHPTTEPQAVVHIRDAVDCQDRYHRTVAAVFDLLLLTRSAVFVGEYNSNWGRLIQTHRTVVENGRARVRDVCIVFGPNETLWPR